MRTVQLFGALVGFAAAPVLAFGQTSQCYPNNPSMPEAGTTCYSDDVPAATSAPHYTIPPNVDCGTAESLLGGCYFKSISGWRRIRSERQKVAELIADHNCDVAMSAALRESDFETAKMVKELCVPSGTH